MTWTALAKKLGVSRSWIMRRRKDPDAPKKPDPKAWEEFALTREAMGGQGSGRMKIKSQSSPDSISVRGKKYTAQDILNFKARLTEEQGKGEEIKTKLKQLELERERQQLVPADEAKKVIAGILTPLRRNLDSMGRAICSRANPQDPQLAEKAINDYIQHLFRGISEGTLIEK